MATAKIDPGALETRVRAHVGTLAPFQRARTVVVAVSGGLDSMTLLHLLRFCGAAPRGAELHAAHFDHAMRPESEDDARWVANICRKWDVTAHVGRAPSAARTEADGRALRYRFLEATRQALGGHGAVVATGHTADDQAETVLFRLARGSGPAGLAGILPWRSPAVARPLLPFWRKELRDFARGGQVPFRDDPSNLDARWVRNRLRRTILPALEDAVPGAGAALAAHAETSRLQARALDELLDDRIAGLASPNAAPARPADPSTPASPALSLDRDALARLPDPLLSLVLRRAAARIGSGLGRSATAALVRFVRGAQSGRRLDLPGGAVAEHDLGTLRFLAPPAPAPHLPAAPGSSVPPRAAGASSPSTGTTPSPATRSSARPRVAVATAAGEAAYTHAGVRVDVAWGRRPLPGFPDMARFGGLDLSLQLVVRPWEPGDRVAMPYGRKKVKKLLLEARVPRRRRAGVPVVAVAEGPVLWVPGAMAAPRAAPSPSRACLYVHVRASRVPPPEPPPFP